MCRACLDDDVAQEGAPDPAGDELAQHAGVPQVARGAVAPGQQRALAADGRRAAVCTRTQQPISLFCVDPDRNGLAVLQKPCMATQSHHLVPV